jgi:hypothetical protein
MTKPKSPREPTVKSEAVSEEANASPMERFRALAKRLARVSKEELQKEADKSKKKRI